MKNYLKKRLNIFNQYVGVECNLVELIHLNKAQLTGQYVELIPILSPISQKVSDDLWETVSTEPDESCWTYLPYESFKKQNELCTALNSQFSFKDSIHYLIQVDQVTVGWVALLNVNELDRTIEIGNVYFSHCLKKSRAATEAIYLLMKEVFEAGFRRLEWKCDDLNLPSKRTATRFGFQFEGVFRQHRISKGRNRNTAWFSILDEEWVSLQKAFQQWLNTSNFDALGKQLNKLESFI